MFVVHQAFLLVALIVILAEPNILQTQDIYIDLTKFDLNEEQTKLDFLWLFQWLIALNLELKTHLINCTQIQSQHQHHHLLDMLNLCQPTVPLRSSQNNNNNNKLGKMYIGNLKIGAYFLMQVYHGRHELSRRKSVYLWTREDPFAIVWVRGNLRSRQIFEKFSACINIVDLDIGNNDINCWCRDVSCNPSQNENNDPDNPMNVGFLIQSKTPLPFKTVTWKMIFDIAFVNRRVSLVFDDLLASIYRRIIVVHFAIADRQNAMKFLFDLNRIHASKTVCNQTGTLCIYNFSFTNQSQQHDHPLLVQPNSPLLPITPFQPSTDDNNIFASWFDFIFATLPDTELSLSNIFAAAADDDDDGDDNNNNDIELFYSGGVNLFVEVNNSITNLILDLFEHAVKDYPERLPVYFCHFDISYLNQFCIDPQTVLSATSYFHHEDLTLTDNILFDNDRDFQLLLLTSPTQQQQQQTLLLPSDHYLTICAYFVPASKGKETLSWLNFIAKTFQGNVTDIHVTTHDDENSIQANTQIIIIYVVIQANANSKISLAYAHTVVNIDKNVTQIDLALDTGETVTLNMIILHENSIPTCLKADHIIYIHK